VNIPDSVYHFGGLIVAPGYTDPVKFVDGNPYGTSHVNGQGAIPVDDTARNAAVFQGKRVATITAALKTGLASRPESGIWAGQDGLTPPTCLLHKDELVFD